MKRKIRKEMFNKDGKANRRYSTYIEILFSHILEQRTFKIHYSFWTGSRKHMTLVDHGWDYICILDSLGIDHKRGNDAPRGGREGDYIEVKVDRRISAIKQILARREEFENDNRKAIDIFNDIING